MMFMLTVSHFSDRDQILLVRPDTAGTYSDGAFREVSDVFIKEITLDAFDVHIHLVRDARSVEAFGEVFRRVKPKILILMDRRSTNLYLRYQHRQPQATVFPPAILLMSMFISSETHQLINAVGIEYQIQAVTSLTNLRGLFRDTKKVGVLYRPEIEPFIETQKVLCKAEKIELISRKIKLKKGGIKPSQLRRAIQNLTQKVDALWIPNDSVLLSETLLTKAWIPGLKGVKIPVVVGIEKFVDRSELIGHFAVVPDHQSLGEQAAELVLQIREDQWQLEPYMVYLPLGIKKILNKKKLSEKQLQGLHTAALLELDHIIKD